MAFEKDSCITGDLMFIAHLQNESFRLEGAGRIRIGTTEIDDCEVILSPQGIFLRKLCDFPQGAMDIRFNLTAPELALKGEAVLYEEIKCTLLKNKFLFINFYFSLPNQSSTVKCRATMLFDELEMHVEHHESLAAISPVEINHCLRSLRVQLIEKLAQDLKGTEQQFFTVDITGCEEAEMPFTENKTSLYNQFQQAHITNYVKPAHSVSGYMKGYLFGGDTSFKNNNSSLAKLPVADRLKAGYLPARQTAGTAKSGYLLPSSHQQDYPHFANGYLPKSNMDGLQRKELKVVPPAMHDVEVSGHNNQPERLPYQINYTEIGIYASRILCLKEMLLGMAELPDNQP